MESDQSELIPSQQTWKSIDEQWNKDIGVLPVGVLHCKICQLGPKIQYWEIKRSRREPAER